MHHRATHFEEVIERLPSRLQELLDSRRCPRSGHPSIPDRPGVYLFSENGVPVYVGQTRRLRSRLRQHTIPSSSQESASFAFLLARASASRLNLAVSGSRKTVATHADFAPIFLAMKDRVSRMDVQFIEILDPIERSIFEMYAALHLGTEDYNSFETH